MQWSKLKAKVETFFAPALSHRVELRATRYHASPDQLGRGYITVDGKEVWNMCSFQFMVKEQVVISALAENTGSPRRDVQEQAREKLQSEGIIAQWDFYRTLESYCNESFEDILTSSNVLIRSLAMLDGRFGKRRLASFDPKHEHPMVQYFYSLRCEVEKLNT